MAVDTPEEEEKFD